MDLRMPDQDGIQALKQIHCQMPNIRALILSIYDDKDSLIQALRAGACGYVLKQCSSSELIEALRVVARGQYYLSPAMQTLLIQDFLKIWRPSSCNDVPPRETLSGREIEVLQRLAEGATNAEIAAGLVISSSTVQTHRTRIMEKLGLKSRADLVKYALRHGLIDLQ
jgi:two-component system response regulator NreC